MSAASCTEGSESWSAIEMKGRPVEALMRAMPRTAAARTFAAGYQIARLQEMREFVREREKIETPRPHPNARLLGIERSPAENAALLDQADANGEAVEFGEVPTGDFDPFDNAFVMA